MKKDLMQFLIKFLLNARQKIADQYEKSISLFSFMNPEVSVILPTYNGEEFIAEAIESITKQNFIDWELIVIDDGSIDNTGKIVKEWQEKDIRIHYIRHHQNKGLPAARNTGIKFAKGEFIAFIDDDDVWLPKKIEIQIKEIKKSNADLVFSNWYIWDFEKGIKVKAFDDNPIQTEWKGSLLETFIRKNLGNPSTAFVKKSSLEKVGLFDENLKSSEDYDLWLRFILNGMEIVFCQQPLIWSRKHPKQMSANTYTMRISRLEVFKKIARKNPHFLIKYPILTKKIICLQGYKFIQDFLKILGTKK